MKRTLLIPILFGIVISAACDSSSNPVASDSRFGGGAGSGEGLGSADEFEAAVASVDLAAGTFTLATGAVLKVTDGTTIDPLGDLFSLQSVEDALNAGAIVRAEGDQVLEDGMLRATNVKFEVDDEALPELDDEFNGTVEAVDVGAGTFTLTNGLVLKMTDATIIDPLGDLLSLLAVEGALNAGTNVRAEGDQVLENGMLHATNVKFEVDNEAQPELDDEFNDTVASVDPAAGSFTLTNGLVLKVTNDTTIDPLGDLLSLQAVEDALNAGAVVRAEGDQVLENGMLRATNVKFEVDEQANLSETRFEALIASFDPEAKTVELVDGMSVEVVATTRIEQKGDQDHLNSLALMAEAVAAGFPVEAKGRGNLVPSDSPTIVAERVEFEFEDGPDDEIRTLVDAVQVGEKSFSVANGLVVRIINGTRIKQSGDDDQLGSLNEVLNALAAGERVEVRAKGFVTGADPATMVAQEVEFERA